MVCWPRLRFSCTKLPECQVSRQARPSADDVPRSSAHTCPSFIGCSWRLPFPLACFDPPLRVGVKSLYPPPTRRNPRMNPDRLALAMLGSLNDVGSRPASRSVNVTVEPCEIRAWGRTPSCPVPVRERLRQSRSDRGSRSEAVAARCRSASRSASSRVGQESFDLNIRTLVSGDLAPALRLSTRVGRRMRRQPLVVTAYDAERARSRVRPQVADRGRTDDRAGITSRINRDRRPLKCQSMVSTRRGAGFRIATAQGAGPAKRSIRLTSTPPR